MQVSRPLWIVEDDEPSANTLMRQLRKLGYDGPIHHTEDTIGAYVLLAEGVEFSGAILDYRLPLGTGIEILEHIRRRDHQMPVLLLTALMDRTITNGAQALKAYYAQKPPADDNLRSFLELRADRERQLNRLELREQVSAKVLPGAKLTARQRDALEARACSRTDQEAADLMGVSVWTLRTHLKAVRARLDVESIGDVVADIVREVLTQA